MSPQPKRRRLTRKPYSSPPAAGRARQEKTRKDKTTNLFPPPPQNGLDNVQFAALCETKGVQEIVGMDRTALTVFAPIDKSLGDLIAKARQRSINLAELAKHHIGKLSAGLHKRLFG